MSKFITSATTKLFSDSQLTPQPQRLTVHSDFSEIVPLVTYGYTIAAVYTQSGHCRREDLGEIKKLFIKGLREDVYGELRSLIHEAQVACYEYDIGKVREYLDKIAEEIWS